MGFKMGFDKESLEGGPLASPGIYTVRLQVFKPRKSNAGDSVNYFPSMAIVNSPDFDGKRVSDVLNSKAGFTQLDFCHAFGLEVEDAGNGQYNLPGEWDGDQNKPETWKYSGPLYGRDAQVELVVHTRDGKTNNNIKRYICSVPGCQIKHSTNLIRD